MPFLDEILDCAEAEISAAKKDRSVRDLKRMIRDAAPVNSFHAALSANFGLIAEVKRRSPSAGEMRRENFEKAPAAYAKSPVVKAVSVLTNNSHFGMGIDQIARIKPLVRKPILRKDFIFREYQIYEARAFGADAVLLMANVLNHNQLKHLFNLCQELGLDVLFEVHTREEIDQIPDGAKIYGVNSRKFMATKRWRFAKAMINVSKMFSKFGIAKVAGAPDPSVELSTFSLIKHLPKHVIKVAESGVKPGRVAEVSESGYNSVLVGTSLLNSPEGVESVLSEFERALIPSRQGISTSAVIATA
jgi:indole-3-glycerol phosphate synthase